MDVLFKNKTIHFIGIGGIGMSGIAQILLRMGFPVQGSDLKKNRNTDELEEMGAKIYAGHHKDHVEGADVVVFTSACDPANPEIIEAKRLHIPIVQRAEMLAELMRLRFGVAIAGSHGKTTTTSIVGQMIHHAGLDPTVVVGGKFRLFNSNVHHGKGDILVAEADESDGSFLHLNPAIAVITNIDREHMNHYLSHEAVKEAFLTFANKVPFYGIIMACLDCPHVTDIYPKIRGRVRSYGFSPQFHYCATDLEKLPGGGSQFEVMESLPGKRRRSLGTFRIHMAGRHNVLNALAGVGVARELGIQPRLIAQALDHFRGVERRLHYLIRTDQFSLVDDYGHHPTEIRATLQAVRETHRGRLITLFQPHRFTRTQDLWREFSTCFGDTDTLYVMDIYAACEQPIEGIHSKALVESIRAHGHQNVTYVSESSKEQILQLLTQEIQPGDTVLTLGAGSTYDYAIALQERLSGRGIPETILHA